MDTFDQIISSVQSDLNISDDNNAQFPLATVQLAINRAYRKIGGLFKWPQLEDSKKTSSVASQEYYDYPDTWRPNSIWKIQIDGDTNNYGDPLTFKDYMYEKENSFPSGLSHMWSNFFKRYYIYPTPTSNGSENIVVWGRKFVALLEADGDETIFSYSMPECNEAIALEAGAILKFKGEDKNVNDLLSPGALQILTKSFKELRSEMSKYEKTQPFFEVPDFYAGRNRKSQNTGNFNY